MSDWQKGDLALCVKRGAWSRVVSKQPNDGLGVRSGSILTVRSVGIFAPYTVLWFEGVGGEGRGDSFVSRNFRKIPPHTPDAEDAETIRLLNGVPVGEPV